MRWYVLTPVVVLLASNAWAIPTPTESRVAVLAFLHAQPSGLLLDQDEDATTQATTIDPIVAGAFAVFGSGNRTLGEFSALWDSTSSGSVRFEADLQVAGIDGSHVSALTNGLWSYSFEADAADSLLRIAYDLDGGTAQVFFDGEFLPQIFDEAPGVLELEIVPRSFEHNLGISYFSTIFQAGFPATLRNEATFTWNIVPEPSTILLLGGGLLVLAASQRRMKD